MPFAMIGTILMGYVFNMYGRRIPLLFSCLVASFCIILAPYTAPSYGWLLFLLIIMSFCIVTLIQAPLINDYVEESSRGKACSVRSFGNNLGYVFVFGFLFQVVKSYEIKD